MAHSNPVTGWTGAKSICKCGHTGDGATSAHGGLIGHGPCEVPGCECEKFTWDRWLPAFAEVVAKKQPT